MRTVLGTALIDGLYDVDRNGMRANAAGAAEVGLSEGRTYEIRELCELVHAESAEVLAEYTDDFYAGRPALTVRRLGAGRAYYRPDGRSRRFTTIFTAVWFAGLASGARWRRTCRAA
ncbi:MAG TPA: beta-galactosidase trimerization domain-containing protein [Paenibacillaceae bacterium]